MYNRSWCALLGPGPDGAACVDFGAPVIFWASDFSKPRPRHINTRHGWLHRNHDGTYKSANRRPNSLTTLPCRVQSEGYNTTQRTNTSPISVLISQVRGEHVCKHSSLMVVLNGLHNKSWNKDFWPSTMPVRKQSFIEGFPSKWMLFRRVLI